MASTTWLTASASGGLCISTENGPTSFGRLARTASYSALLLGRQLIELHRLETGHIVLPYFSGVLPSGGRTSKLFRKIPTMA